MLFKLYEKNNNPKDIDKIIQLLNDGGIIIIPTDTVYAISCNGMKNQAVERICRLKKIDPSKHHLSIICSDLSHISEYAKVSNSTFKLMKRNLPGPFTFVLPVSSNLPKVFRNRKEVGIRIPDNNIVKDICMALNAPLFSTTLPREEDEDIEYITDPELIDEKFGNDVDLVIDGGIGGIKPSTVIDCTTDNPEIIRQGKGELNN
ncbi:MAG: L-threonylcarbamoyladenylate synthase [Phocaeicola sp.]|uniref:L-threonylcarbamoyladenylate synthase n=1 Tax=Phocaeicola sp. TaxID=2773926 RepID=UPI003FA136CD